MGKFLIKINDWLMIVLVVVFTFISTVAIPLPILGTLVGIVFGAVVGGFWFVLSGIYHNSKRIVDLLEKKQEAREIKKTEEMKVENNSWDSNEWYEVPKISKSERSST